MLHFHDVKVVNLITLRKSKMRKQIMATMKELVEFIDKRTYSYLAARPYYKVGRSEVSYAPVPHYDRDIKAFIPRGDIEGWINEVPVDAVIFIDTIIQEEKYSSEKFKKIDSNKFFYSISKTRIAKSIDDVLKLY